MPFRRQNRTMWLGVAVGLGLLIATVVAAAAWRPASTVSPAPESEPFSHVHGLGVNPGDGLLYVATHHGIFRLSEGKPTRVGDGRQDTMGFTVIGPDQFLASGHPAAGGDQPAHLGLTHSTDAGRTWRTLSLAGQADFHILRAAADVTYGVDSTSGALMASADRVTWQVRAHLEAYDVAVDPERPDTVVATTGQGVQRSTDGGRTWSPAGGSAVLMHWLERDRLVAVTADGHLLNSVDGGETWSPTGGRIPGAPAAFTAYGETVYVATRDARVMRSADGGMNWQPMS